MLVNQETCAGCGECVPYCPVGAISLAAEVARIDRDECVECSLCLRIKNCTTGSIVREDLAWPRIVRNAMSDVLAVHKITGLGGRGTEEMKTNEVTGRYRKGFVGIAVEFGRPSLGARFYDIQKVAQAAVKFGADFEKDNPISALMADQKKAVFPGELLPEKILTGILEFIIEEKHLIPFLKLLEDISREIETVFSLGVMARCEPDGSLPVLDTLKGLGLELYPNGKTNVGLGKRGDQT